jgi:phenylpyruvate tautomerase PptA (4-oxalocrotonate tautomerase family)
MISSIMKLNWNQNLSFHQYDFQKNQFIKKVSSFFLKKLDKNDDSIRILIFLVI